jgi:hypothetical protein
MVTVPLEPHARPSVECHVPILLKWPRLCRINSRIRSAVPRSFIRVQSRLATARSTHATISRALFQPSSNSPAEALASALVGCVTMQRKAHLVALPQLTANDLEAGMITARRRPRWLRAAARNSRRPIECQSMRSGARDNSRAQY